MVTRGDIHWYDFGHASGSTPAKRRPVVVVQAERFNASRLATTLVLALTSNTDLAAMPGNVFLPAASTDLQRDSVANVTTITAVNKVILGVRVGAVPVHLLDDIDAGLRLVLGLSVNGG